MIDPSTATEPAPILDDKPARLASLDVFRGLTVAGMILVNNPGSGAAYPPLHHAEWDGWTPTDLVFPFFLLIVGVAIPFAFSKRRETGAGRFGLVLKVVRRSLVIFAIGLGLNALGPILNSGFANADWSKLRIPGVLQRIAVCYLFASLIELMAGIRAKIGIVVVLLVGYWLAMTLIRLPDHKTGDLSRSGNLAAIVDRALLKGHLYKADYDPEGLLSTLPAVATTLIGVLAGYWLRSKRGEFEKDAGLFVAGWFGVVLGPIWGAIFLVNKALWTSSYVLLTAGLGLQGLAVCYWLVDIHRIRAWSRPFAILGMNAIAAYVFSGLLGRFLGMVRWQDGTGQTVTVKGWTVETLFRPWLSPMGASLAFALLFVAVCFTPIYLMHRKGIYLKA
jgi:predicted acyltransferase